MLDMFSKSIFSSSFVALVIVEYLSLANNPLGGTIPSILDGMPHLGKFFNDSRLSSSYVWTSNLSTAVYSCSCLGSSRM